MHRQKLIVDIVNLEWEMFTNAQNSGGRADCQDDLQTFIIMRSAQASVWENDTLESYHGDLENAAALGINLMMLKYARMMEITFPAEYAQIKDMLPEVSEETTNMVGIIAAINTAWAQEIAERYPKLSSLGRPADYASAIESGVEQWAAQDNYLRSELLTYSEHTLELCMRDTLDAQRQGRNMVTEILEATVERYGYASLDAAEAAM
ncbi:MAG: DUF4125 family protein [Oscillospiraceae bacterium]|jgi:hypothetical protein|nr:DUF4125 family protein [Oscillospiraceae bacterium]